MPMPLLAGGSGVFEQTGSLSTGRSSHAATLLPNGKVLVAGIGEGDSTELYDSASGTWTATGNLGVEAWHFTVTLLPNGKVLAVGGETAAGDVIVSFAGCELYDPANGTWTSTANLGHARDYHTATLLPNGKVLVAGGFDSGNDVTSTELYDPVAGMWTTTGSPVALRRHSTATLLPNGKVLIVGGRTIGAAYSSATELYDPASGTWTSTGSLSTARQHQTATLLPNGKVLVAGGYNNTGSLTSAELYDPTSGSWTSTGSLGAARDSAEATLLPDGKVLVIGGSRQGPGGAILPSAELYDPANGTWTATGSLAAARVRHTATLLPNGQVLVAAGIGNTGTTASAELYLGPPAPPTLLNVSTRLVVLTGDEVLIGGFIVTGTDLKRVLVRGIGPSLNGLGFTLNDPTLELHQGSTILATNDNWKMRADLTSQQADIEGTTIPPTNDSESAILMSLSPGAYTAVLSGKNEGTGVGLVEVYDLGRGANSKLANISTRGFVHRGDNVMIGGLIAGGGSGGGATRVVVRALGPSLPVTGPLGDPNLELRDGSGTLVASNDNWKTRPDGSSQQAEIEATTIPPTNDLESALVRTLAPDNYTVIVRGSNGTIGVGLVEAYHLP
jgi:WD40 repeat protein